MRRLDTPVTVLLALVVIGLAGLVWWLDDDEPARPPRATPPAVTAGGYAAGTVVGLEGDALAAAADALPSALSFDAADLDGTLERATARMTPDFAERYAGILRDAVRPWRGREVTATARVRGAGIVPGRGSGAATEGAVEVLAFVDQDFDGVPRGGDDVVRTRVLVTMVPAGDGWRIDALTVH